MATKAGKASGYMAFGLKPSDNKPGKITGPGYDLMAVPKPVKQHRTSKRPAYPGGHVRTGKQ